MQTKDQSFKAISLGLLSALFLSSTFILNSVMAVSGSYWAWTAALRYLFVAPILLVILLLSKNLRPLLNALAADFKVWMLWGTLGFGVFYALLSFASTMGPGWLIAGTFQTTIIAGLLIAPFIYKDARAKISPKALGISGLILLGIITIQSEHATAMGSLKQLLICSFMVILAAFLWPLGNRKIMLHMEKKNIELNASQRVLGMAIGCLPFLILLSGFAYSQKGWPVPQQLVNSSLVAIFAGVLGGICFFKATHLVKENSTALAGVEATQAASVLFTLIGEVILLHVTWPGWIGNLGMGIIFIGIILYSRVSAKKQLKTQVSEEEIALTEL